MRKQQVLLSGLLMLMSIGMADAQKAYTYVQQNDTKLDQLGTAAFDLSSSPTVEFVDGKAVMTVGDNQVAVLPMDDGGQLAVDLTGTESNVSMTLTDGYATVYSPFQLQVPLSGDVEVYVPTYENGTLKLNEDTKVAPGAILPAGTGVILKNTSPTLSASTIDFTFSAEAATDSHESALSGSALATTPPAEEEGKTLYALGYSNVTGEYGFFPYNGESMAPGTVYLLVDNSSESEGQTEDYVSFNGEEEDPDAISFATALSNASKDGKFIRNGRIIIVKSNKQYNLNGQKLY